jgi:hypothetical protein
VRTSTHVPEQLVSPLGHWHVPLKHCVPPPHLVPQVPQLAASDLVSVQPMLHAVRPVVQAAVHALAEHSVVVPLHLVPHAPQLSGSLVVSTHAPEQVINPPPQVGPPPVPVVVLPLPVVVVLLPLPVVAPPVPAVVPLLLVVAPPVPLLLVVLVVVMPVELLPHPAAIKPVIPAKSEAPMSQEARER